MSGSPATHQFNLEAFDGAARAGKLRLATGEVSTPAFMPVGTQAAVKALDPPDLRAAGVQIVLANTYHLSLRPGADVIALHGGVSRFMRWDGPVLTDSGGFQVFSLAARRRITHEGVEFRSHIDGSLHMLTPERAIEHQRRFRSDISMALDVCVGFGATEDEQRDAMEVTHAWLPRNLAAFESVSDKANGLRRLLFGISQGGFDAARRRSSASLIADSNVDGCAIGGLSVGEPKEVMSEMLQASIAEFPIDRPRYLMGVGSPEDLWSCVAAGVDMFDCVLPTRVARRGAVYTRFGRINITSSRHLDQAGPIDPDCDCLTCTTYPSGYVCHLFRTRELLGYRLASIHNLRFVQRQMEAMRSAIVDGRFGEAYRDFSRNYRAADQVVAAAQRAKFRARRRPDS